MPVRLGFLTTHPIQYQVPVFRALAKSPDVELTVLYCMIPNEAQQGDGFGVRFQWDLPLLDGYDHLVLNNVSSRPGVTTFRGCDTPDVGRVLRDRQFDALVVNGWVVKSCLQGLRACRRLGVPCLVRGEANDLRERAWWKRTLQRRLVNQYAACLYIGEANRAFYERRGIAADRLFPALYCIENRRFQLQAERQDPVRSELRRRWSIGRDEVCFLFSGKFIPKKHPVELIAAFHRAVRRGVQARLMMVGDGELRTRCEAYVREHQLPVTFAGFLNQTEIVDAYVAADCLILPSDHGETWGLVVNEAMACGRPAIVSDQAGCAADLIVPGQTGHVFRFGDWDGLADLMNRVADDPETVHAQGAAAQRHIGRYSPELAAAGIGAAVRSVVHEGATESAARP